LIFTAAKSIWPGECPSTFPCKVDALEQEDGTGGAELGRQREAARRRAVCVSEHTKFEEDNMMGLTVTHVKRRQRLMRKETSNLNAISDLGNLVRDLRLRKIDDDEASFVSTGKC
jgi:hypothetical protein